MRNRPSSWRRREPGAARDRGAARERAAPCERAAPVAEDAAVTRVIAGAARGRRLALPAGRLTRPTSDRAREGLFGTLLALHGPLDGASVLDLYAGSGAVGLEALSRGARRALFVEADPRAARGIQANIEAVGLPGAELATDRVDRLLARGPGGQGGFGLVVADPPYATSDPEVAG